MIFLKNISKSILYTISSIIILTIILTIFNYFSIFNGTIVKVFKVINLIISILIGSALIGNKSDNKGWLEGLKFGLIMAVIIFMFNFLGLNRLDYLTYVVIILTSIIGGMLGISLKKNWFL